MSRHILIVLIASSFLFFNACSSGPKRDSNTPKGAYLEAQDLDKDERYEEALQKYADVKNRFPYSRYAVLAELAIADVQYKKEAFIEAQASYELFKELHPRHPKSDYVTFRLAMSFYSQLPGTIDRDLSLAKKAIVYFNELMKNYPQSKHVKDAKKHRAECVGKLAQKELYIAEFYFIRDMYDSALKRYEEFINSDISNKDDHLAEALFGAGVSAFELGESGKGKRYLAQLIRNYPKAELASEAKEKLESYGGR
jgi:outer membrane protein assembly factor BamD